MRRVHVRTGLVQRMGDILGTDTGAVDENDIPELTNWSIQAQMIENVRRVVKGIVGTAVGGRPAGGLYISAVSSGSVTIGSGYGFTANGDVIVIQNPITKLSESTTVDKYLYLKHINGTVPNTTVGGKESSFINGNTAEEIVYDDYASIQSGTSNANLYVVWLDEAPNGSVDGINDMVYLGKLIPTQSEFIQNNNRGVDINSDGDVSFGTTAANTVKTNSLGVRDAGYITLASDIQGSSAEATFDTVRANNFQSGATPGIDATVTISGVTLVFSDGLLTSHTSA